MWQKEVLQVNKDDFEEKFKNFWEDNPKEEAEPKFRRVETIKVQKKRKGTLQSNEKLRFDEDQE